MPKVCLKYVKKCEYYVYILLLRGDSDGSIERFMSTRTFYINVRCMVREKERSGN